MVILREKKEMKKGTLFKNVRSIEEIDDFGKPSVEKISRFGFSADIGTTTVVIAGFAFLEGGERMLCIGRKTALNAQTALGKDVMMRVMHALSGKKRELQEMIVKEIEGLAEEILDSAGLSAREAEVSGKTEFVIVGNTTMCHLLLGESVEGLKGTPFRMAYTGNRLVSGGAIGCQKFSEAQIFVLSGIAAHVGGDALSVLCETGMNQEKKILLAIDFGTNAEILLNDHGVLWCCSAAAGPAFEGRGVSCGRIAGPGVICGVKLAANTGNIILEYIPGKEVCGICGSGLIDLLAELRKVGVITEDGYLLSKDAAAGKPGLQRWSENIIEDFQGDRAFLVYEGEKKIFLTQKDIRNLQLAKGAIGAAVLLLLRETGLRMESLDGLILTGVLGSSIRLENAIRIGLVPRFEKEKVIFSGNAAFDGAVSLLQSGELRKEWERTAEEVRHLELAEQKDFSTLFMKSVEIGSIL